VPVEWVFDQGIGDIFVGRVAGNVATIDQLGSMEFATKVAGTKLILVLGHEACGAVKGACDGVEMGNLTALLKKIQPAVEAVEGFAPENRNSKDAAFVEAVVEENVRQTVAEIRRVSPLLAEMEQKGDILIVGGLYSLQDGSVKVIE
jgi:carbonic anhydrase